MVGVIETIQKTDELVERTANFDVERQPAQIAAGVDWLGGDVMRRLKPGLGEPFEEPILVAGSGSRHVARKRTRLVFFLPLNRDLGLLAANSLAGDMRIEPRDCVEARRRGANQALAEHDDYDQAHEYGDRQQELFFAGLHGLGIRGRGSGLSQTSYFTPGRLGCDTRPGKGFVLRGDMASARLGYV